MDLVNLVNGGAHDERSILQNIISVLNIAVSCGTVSVFCHKCALNQ